ncbi:hypothetical protein [Ligilactobacillus ruminis]|uniref:Uncharacterized protein n=3 Tax=Ligilactobacillus ruminis TaxID=1623 RepID=A0A837IMY4_9LACO|nr:hypothetical protein [Ligilactobacillus ruminis]AEN77778.1 Hypothetical membrane protein [Ligilactobacillus ruminis ATCC 27782]KLA44620.1 hypothetical protein LRB_1721 [Ligilactobacillus ruminis]MCR5748909.1 hypothetical protein [Lactobacillus sp.]SFG40236.1 hypothetical protein SAMN02910432_01221 [Ligilactobacillus ruminis DSM 20403 = NBRC 102161]
MTLINGKMLLRDFMCGFVVIFAMVVCFVSISFEGTVLNESYLLKQNEQSKYVQKYKRIYDEVLIYCAQSVDFSSEQAREMSLTNTQMSELLVGTTKGFCRGNSNLVDVELFSKMSEDNLRKAIKNRRIKATQRQLYNFHANYKENAARYFRIKLANSGIFDAQKLFISAKRKMKYMPLISMFVIVAMMFVYYFFNDNDCKKVMRWFGKLLFIASLCTVLIALLVSLSNESVLSDNSVVEFDSLFMNYVSTIQNLFWIIGLCSFGIGSFMIFISSDGFLKLLDAVKYNSAY